MANPTGKRSPQPTAKPKPKPMQNTASQAGKSLLGQSYGVQGSPGATQNGMNAVMGYYNSLPPKQKAAALAALNARTQATKAGWTGAGTPNGVLFQDLDPAAREAYAKAYGPNDPSFDPKENGGGSIFDVGAGESFTKGVSGKTGAFITEKGQSRLAAGEADTKTTKTTPKKKAQRKKLVKRAVKKTNVKGKAIRRAIRSEGITKSDKKVYKKVAAQSNPKLSSRLRVADRRNDSKRKSSPNLGKPSVKK